MTTQKPDYMNMSAKELVEAHNALTGGNRRAPFDSKADAIRRCEKLWAEQNPVIIKPQTTIAESKKIAGKFKAAKKTPQVKALSGMAPLGISKEGNSKEPRASLQRVIAIVPGTDPPREGTCTRKHYDQMGGSPTVGEYLDKFKEDRKRASQELRNVIRGGRVALKG